MIQPKITMGVRAQERDRRRLAVVASDSEVETELQVPATVRLELRFIDNAARTHREEISNVDRAIEAQEKEEAAALALFAERRAANQAHRRQHQQALERLIDEKCRVLARVGATGPK